MDQGTSHSVPGQSTSIADSMDQGTGDSALGQSTSVTDNFVVKLKLPWPVKEEPLDQPSAVYGTVQPMSDNSSGSPLSQKTCLACHLCSAVFELSNSLKLHMETFHKETLHCELPVASRLHDSAGENTDQLPDGQGRISSHMTKDSRKDSVTSANDFVIKLESPWSVKEEPQDQPSSVYSTAQPMSDNTSGSVLSLNTSHVCQRCSTTFVLSSSLELHMVTLHGETMQDWFPMNSAYQCNGVGYHCGSKFENVSDYKKAEVRRKEKAEDSYTGRRDQEKQSKKHVCNVCGRTFLQAIHLKEHELMHAGLKPFVCDVCSKTFDRHSSLKRHKLIHAVHKPFVCDVCSKAFAHPATLKRHKKTHTNQVLKSYVCDMCSEAFTQYLALKSHKVIHKVPKSFICDVCDKSFTRSNTLKHHMLTHTGQKPFVCDVCSQAFTYAHALKQHKMNHTGLKPFVCHVCTKAFSLSCVFKRHMLLHTGHKPFVCDVCSKAFSCSSALTCHKLIHTGLKSFVCEVCSKGFTRDKALKQHMLIHTDYKSFVCDVCNKAFTQAGNLKAHKVIHTGLKPFTCDVCYKTFTWSSALKRHKRVHTEEKT